VWGVCLGCGFSYGLGAKRCGWVVLPWGLETFVKHDANQREID